MSAGVQRELWELRAEGGVGPQFLLDHAAEHGNWVLYTPDESLSLTDLGLLLRSQQVGEARPTRPLFVMEEWLESQYYRDHLPLEDVPG
ncbi:hypothetical protein ABZY10_24065 [Streptomyces sp. NPDC006539]|uniref:hypothetical protein n=1 Tax=Streptomyces TaxID=1883 RepID=UPI0033983DB5